MPAPIFIIGSPRSGTSALTWAIGQHPNIALLPETHWLPYLAAGARDAFRLGSSRGQFSHLSNVGMTLAEFLARFGETADRLALDTFERRVAEFFPTLRRDGNPEALAGEPQPRLIHDASEPKQRWVDGTPQNTLSVHALSLLFPEARFIHLLRRPEEVANSLAHFENAGSHGINMVLSDGLRLWLWHVRAAAQAERALGSGKVLRVHNEDLRHDAADTLAGIFDFLGEANAPNALLPLAGGMNSSRADEHHDANHASLRDNPAFVEAEMLYQALRDAGVPAVPDAAERERLRAAFEDVPSPSEAPAATTLGQPGEAVPGRGTRFASLLRLAGRHRSG